jgi:hypothetical protein
MPQSDLDEFHGVLRRCWSVETSPQWLPEHPAREIPKTPVGNDWHFYNRVAGTVSDLTAEQFCVLPAHLDIPATRDDTLAGTAPERYQALADRVSEALASK